jgi:hypothetical protein
MNSCLQADPHKQINVEKGAKWAVFNTGLANPENPNSQKSKTGFFTIERLT